MKKLTVKQVARKGEDGLVFDGVDLSPLYRAVGELISRFSEVDLSLGILFADLVGARNRAAAVTGFHETRNIDAKIRTITVVGMQALPEDKLKEWNTLCSRLKSLASIRNRVAHWTIGQANGLDEVIEGIELYYGVVPPHWHRSSADVVWNEGQGTGAQPIDLKELDEEIERLIRLQTDLINFTIAVGDALKGE
jgi:hypothetical protein